MTPETYPTTFDNEIFWFDDIFWPPRGLPKCAWTLRGQKRTDLEWFFVIPETYLTTFVSETFWLEEIWPCLLKNFLSNFHLVCDNRKVMIGIYITISTFVSLCPFIAQYSKSKNVGNKSCQVCFRDDKNAFGITPWPLGAGGAIGGPWGCQNQISSNQKVSLTKVVRYVSRVTKIHLGSPSDPWGPGGTRGGAGGVKIKFHQVKKFQ